MMATGVYIVAITGYLGLAYAMAFVVQQVMGKEFIVEETVILQEEDDDGVNDASNDPVGEVEETSGRRSARAKKVQ
jgi:hypothetical protein